MHKISFHRGWFAAFISLFLIETGIAIYVHDSLIRPFFGDVLVIWLMYAFIKSFMVSRKMDIYLAAGIFLFACLIEIGQYFGLAALLHLRPASVLGIIIGATFDWMDMLAYGAATLLLMVLIFFQRHPTPENK